MPLPYDPRYGSTDPRHPDGRCISYRDHLDTDHGAMAYDAILRNLAVIGEAVRTLPTDVKSEFPATPWASIAGLRNVVVHEYFKINPDLIREVVDHDLAELAASLRRARPDEGWRVPRKGAKDVDQAGC